MPLEYGEAGHPFAEPLAKLAEWLRGEGGNLPLNSTSLAYESSRIVKFGPGYLMGLTVYSSNVAAQFVQVFDHQGVPADGAIPAVVLHVAATSTATLTYVPLGRLCYQGIVVCNSSTGPTKTIGAADCFFDVQYI